MLGDRSKHCIFQLFKLLNSTKHTGEYNVINEMMADATKDIEELLEIKERYTEMENTLKVALDNKDKSDARVKWLEKENKHKTEMVHLLMDSVGLRHKSHYVHELTDKLNQLKQDALLGMALKWAKERNETSFIGCETCVFEIDTELLLESYQQQLKEEDVPMVIGEEV